MDSASGTSRLQGLPINTMLKEPCSAFGDLGDLVIAVAGIWYLVLVRPLISVHQRRFAANSPIPVATTAEFRFVFIRVHSRLNAFGFTHHKTSFQSLRSPHLFR